MTSTATGVLSTVAGGVETKNASRDENTKRLTGCHLSAFFVAASAGLVGLLWRGFVRFHDSVPVRVFVVNPVFSPQQGFVDFT